MKLHEICPIAIGRLPDTDVRSITDNTNALQAGDVFVCITGRNFDGHSAAAEMLDKGAVAVITDHDLNLKNQVVVSDTRKTYSEMAKAFYGNPAKNLKLIAVTGTNGKSTVACMIRHMLNASGKKCGMIGTIEFDVCGRIYEAHMTTPYPMELYRLLSEMSDNGAEYCVIEASSQALSQSRFSAERFVTAVFTNLTHDHLDWHRTMEEYFLAKRSLFGMCDSAVICEAGFGIDKYVQKLKKYLSQNETPFVTCNVGDAADFYAVNQKRLSFGTSFWLSGIEAEKSFPVTVKMPGEYNVMNALAAVAAVSAATDLPLAEIVKNLNTFAGVKGRAEVLYEGKFLVIRDYAHTADALEKFLLCVRPFVRNRLICLFGAAGERDAAKRPAMGKTVARLSDYMIVTSDNPRFERQQNIIDDVLQGTASEITPLEYFADRKEAIHRALTIAEDGDVIALCGKGHETYQVIGDDYQPFDEKEIVLEKLR